MQPSSCCLGMKGRPLKAAAVYTGIFAHSVFTRSVGRGRHDQKPRATSQGWDDAWQAPCGNAPGSHVWTGCRWAAPAQDALGRGPRHMGSLPRGAACRGVQNPRANGSMTRVARESCAHPATSRSDLAGSRLPMPTDRERQAYLAGRRATPDSRTYTGVSGTHDSLSCTGSLVCSASKRTTVRVCLPLRSGKLGGKSRAESVCILRIYSC